MSKKVVHLSDDAHELAKAHCKDSGMKMSDWVAMLIKRAVDPAVPAPSVVHSVVMPPSPPMPVREPLRESYGSLTANHPVSVAARSPSLSSDDAVRSLAPKKKPLLRELVSENEDTVPVYAQPPFWARAKSS